MLKIITHIIVASIDVCQSCFDHCSPILNPVYTTLHISLPCIIFCQILFTLFCRIYIFVVIYALLWVKYFLAKTMFVSKKNCLYQVWLLLVSVCRPVNNGLYIDSIDSCCCQRWKKRTNVRQWFLLVFLLYGILYFEMEMHNRY